MVNKLKLIYNYEPDIQLMKLILLNQTMYYLFRIGYYYIICFLLRVSRDLFFAFIYFTVIIELRRKVTSLYLAPHFMFV